MCSYVYFDFGQEVCGDTNFRDDLEFRRPRTALFPFIELEDQTTLTTTFLGYLIVIVFPACGRTFVRSDGGSNRH
jgi:hypothetical protein